MQLLRSVSWYLALACVGAPPSDGPDPDTGSNDVVTRVVGPEGGELRAPDGSWSLTIPASALADETTIRVGVSEDLPGPLDETLASVGPVLHFEPSGLDFGTPLVLRVAYSQGHLVEGGIEERMLRFGFVEEDGSTEVVESAHDPDANVLVVELPHFSFGGVLRVSVGLVALGTITSPSAVEAIAGQVASELGNPPPPMTSQEYYEDNAALLRPFMLAVLDVLGPGFVAETFPGAVATCSVLPDQSPCDDGRPLTENTVCRGGECALPPCTRSWVVTDLGVDVWPNAVGDGGHVVGSIGSGVTSDPFRWHEGVLTVLSHGGTGAAARGVNLHGVAVGSTSEPFVAYRWPADQVQPEVLADLDGGLDWAEAYGINDAGLVTGMSHGTELNRYLAVIWDGDEVLSLGAFDSLSPGSRGFAINNARQVVGDSVFSDGHGHGFLWNAYTGLVDVGVPSGFVAATGTAVNDYGVAVGFAADITKLPDVALRWSKADGLHVFDPLPGYPDHVAHGVNNAQLVVGYAGTTDRSDSRAWFWEPSAPVTDMNAHLGPASAGWVVTSARGVNNLDWVIGVGINPAGQEVGFVAIPE